MQNVDIVIIGESIASLTLAYGLRDSGLYIVVLENNYPETISSNSTSKFQISVINIASEKLFNRIGIWSEIFAHRTGYYHGIELWDKDGFGHITFNGTGINYNYLGHVIENKIIRNILRQQVQKCYNVILFSSIKIQQIIWDENYVFITLQNGDVFAARLLVGADGSNSWVRRQADIPLIFWDYRYYVLVATVHTVLPHSSIAWQTYHNNGILTFLPLNDPHLCFIIWSLESDKAHQMLEITSEVFNQELCVAFDNRLGLCNIKSNLQIFPLNGYYARKFVNHRLILIGDAAYNIHPLVEQEININLMDIAKLIEELRRLHYEGKDIGQYIYLRCYERDRKYNAAVILAKVQSFRKLFTGSNLNKKLLRSIGLKLASTIPCIKEKIFYQIIGFNDLPKWLC